jgi:hypothetical protein
MRQRNVLVLTRSQEQESRACVDVDAVSVAKTLSVEAVRSSATHTVVFLGAGCADAEMRVLRQLSGLGVKVADVAFFDDTITTAALHRIQEYTEGLIYHNPRPSLVFRFSDLRQWVERLLVRARDRQLIIVGINAGMSFETSQDLYECHAFLCQCSVWARHGVLHADYMNFLGDLNSVKTPHTTECTPGTWCYRLAWWQLAKEVITNTDAERLLAGCCIA